MRVLVIGAGSSGLVVAKTLRERGHEVSIVEASAVVGGTFENKCYKNARMVSSKILTCFSDFRRPEAEMHMTLPDYVTYLRDYASHYGLNKYIRFTTCVERVERQKSGRYIVKVTARATESNADTLVESSEEWDAVAVCSGLHNVPRVPRFPGQDLFEGTVLHSSTYKSPEIFRDKRVLVVGTGETGFDLGYAAATNGARSVTMSTRHGFVSVPADFGENNPPLDCIIMNWGTHCWESLLAQHFGLHWWITTKFNRLGFLFATGSTWGFNQWVGRRYNMSWDEGRKHIVNKSVKCMPLLNRMAKRRAPWYQQWLYSWWDDVEGQDIDLVEGSITEFDAKSVCYKTAKGHRSVDADVVVLATGYRQLFPFLDSLDCDPDRDSPLPSKHFIVNPEEPQLAYIGFVRPNVGAIPPIAEMQAMWWCQRLEDKLVATAPEYYKLKDCRLPYGVDYGYYMFALAKEIGSIPSLAHWFPRNYRAAIAACFGQAHVPIFRLNGPFADTSAEGTCSGELFNIILKRRELNLVFLVEAVGLAVLNVCTSVPGLCAMTAVAAFMGGQRLKLLNR